MPSPILQTDQPTVRKVLNSWGVREVRCAAVPRRQGVSSGWEKRRDGSSPAAFGLAGVNLHTSPVGAASRTGTRSWRTSRMQQGVHRCPPERSAPVSRRRARRLRQRAEHSRLDHLEAAGAAVTPALDSSAGSAARKLRRRCRGGQGRVQRGARCAMMSRAAAIHRAWLEHAHACGNRIDDFSPADRRIALPHHTARGPLHRQKGGFYDGRYADLRAVVEHFPTRRSISI